ncbi:MAG TPA: hypothetical protein VGG01_00500 [Xanthobacteraceae bacterium]|jgi:hypothetical protein
MTTTARQIADVHGTPSLRLPHDAAMVAALAFALALAASPALAQSAAAPPAPPAVSPAIQGYGDHDKTCLAWSDGCVSCRAGADHAAACTNIGIACQPQAIACSERQEKQDKPAK